MLPVLLILPLTLTLRVPKAVRNHERQDCEESQTRRPSVVENRRTPRAAPRSERPVRYRAELGVP